jgi:hypothetical protein
MKKVVGSGVGSGSISQRYGSRTLPVPVNLIKIVVNLIKIVVNLIKIVFYGNTNILIKSIPINMVYSYGTVPRLSKGSVSGTGGAGSDLVGRGSQEMG